LKVGCKRLSTDDQQRKIRLWRKQGIAIVNLRGHRERVAQEADDTGAAC
jgi:hypothetical protein